MNLDNFLKNFRQVFRAQRANNSEEKSADGAAFIKKGTLFVVPDEDKKKAAQNASRTVLPFYQGIRTMRDRRNVEENRDQFVSDLSEAVSLPTPEQRGEAFRNMQEKYQDIDLFSSYLEKLAKDQEFYYRGWDAGRDNVLPYEEYIKTIPGDINRAIDDQLDYGLNRA